MLAIPIVVATVPSWVWATLLMTLFVLVSAGTMWLVRYPLRNLPPPPKDKARRDPANEE